MFRRTRLRQVWALWSRYRLSRSVFATFQGTGAEMYPAIVSGIVTGDALVSYWSTFSITLVTVPEVFAKSSSPQFSRFWIVKWFSWCVNNLRVSPSVWSASRQLTLFLTIKWHGNDMLPAIFDYATIFKEVVTWFHPPNWHPPLTRHFTFLTWNFLMKCS